jgi:pseudomonalisin
VQSPEDLRSVYEHPPGVTGQGTSVAILGNGATDSVIADLHAFDAEHGIPPVPVDVVHVPAGGDFSDTSGNIEWNIDMQAIHGMAPGISGEVLYFAPSLADSELTAAIGAWVNDPNRAYVRGTDSAGNVARKLPKTAIRAFRVR